MDTEAAETALKRIGTTLHDKILSRLIDGLLLGNIADRARACPEPHSAIDSVSTPPDPVRGSALEASAFP